MSQAGSPNTRSRGTSTLEVIVAFTLLSGALSVATPLIVRHGRMLTEYHDYQHALEELTNQMERLTALPGDQLPAAVNELAVSAWSAAELPDAQLRGQLESAEMGTKLTLQLTWNEPGRRERPVTLTAWIYSEPALRQAFGPRPRARGSAPDRYREQAGSAVGAGRTP